MNSLSDYVLEKAQSKTGLSTAVVVGYGLQALFGIGSVILLFVAIFFVFSNYLAFGPTATSIGMFFAFVVMLAGAMLWTSSAKKRTMEDAQRALQGHSFIGLNAPLLNAGVQLGRKMGWQKALPALFALFAATGVAAEWSRRHHAYNDDQR